MGHIADAKIQTNQARKYQDIIDSVNKACNAIYNQGVPIGGAYVQRLLKPISTVPTLVSLYLVFGPPKCSNPDILLGTT